MSESISPELRRHLRVDLLKCLAEAKSLGMGLRGLVLAVKVQTHFKRVSEAEIEDELDYLIDKGFVVKERPPMSPELVTYKRTAAGRDFLAEEGLE